jgi:arabinose-5-phosphate isomerase
MNDSQNNPATLVRIEAEALEQLAQRLEGPQRLAFESVAHLLAATARSGHRTILTGIGKSGLIARKIAATLLSTGTPSAFLHPTEALHGDLGLLTPGDILLALSYSGETEELLRLLPVLPRLRVTLITFTGTPDSTLARASAHTLDVSVDREACNHQLAPTASTTTMLALGDALAIDVSRRLNFQPQHFAELHPGGQLGRRLTTVQQLMHAADALPIVAPTATMPEIIHEISARRLGITTIQSHGNLLGILSDGDLRRLFERDGPAAFHHLAAAVMNPHPHTIAPTTFASEALTLMELHKITALIVTTDGTPTSTPIGILHLHDLWQTLSPSDPAPKPLPPHYDPPSDDGRL